MASITDLEAWGYLFYVASPNRTSFKTLEEVPDYSVLVVPHFFVLSLLETILLKKRKMPVRINDMITSISQGMLSELSRLFLNGWKFAAYIYIYNNWRLATLPWNSAWTWWIAFIIVDFIYYWGHRASHEINFLWAAHQVHHSSEDYNLSTALRQSAWQSVFLSVFYLPMALAVPPSVYLVHSSFNLLFQFWIHTELIHSLGPLEYVLNTASHHRVHHGRNVYCIDKNYAGCLIIWDRMFGTFESEKEEVVYGLTHPINTFEPFHVQMCHYVHIWKTVWSTNGFKNKLSVIFKGPGWMPGTPWHGNIEDIPEIKAPVEKFDPSIPTWCKVYAVVHGFLLIFLYHELMQSGKIMSPAVLYPAILYQVFTQSCLGILLDARQYAPWTEVIRCILYVPFDYYFLPHTKLMTAQPWIRMAFTTLVRITFLSSGIFWIRQCIKNVKITSYSKKLK